MAYILKNIKYTPFKDATELRITSDYGNRTITINGKQDTSFHEGIDINNKDENMIVAIDKGVVIEMVNNRDGYSNTKGNYVYIKHDNCYSIYQHLKYHSVTVKVGDVVEKGQVIGEKGATGYVTGVHLHFGIKTSNKWVDPKPYLLGEKDINNITLPKPVEPNNKIDQVEVIVDKLRARTSPKIASNNIIGFAKKGYYNILDTFMDDKYTWYEVEQDKWVADNGSYLKIHHAKIEESPKTENKPISETKEENNIIELPIPETIEKPIENEPIIEDNNEYYEEKEKNNPLLWLLDVIFNFIKKMFTKRS